MLFDLSNDWELKMPDSGNKNNRNLACENT